MRLSVIIPVYNEIKTVGKVIEEIISLDLGIEKEIIVVDDGSDDGTKDYLNNLKYKELKVLFHQRNLGKTQAIRTALPEVQGEVIVIQDADLEYPPRENYKLMLEPIIKGYADVVYGSRFLGIHRVFMFWHYFANKFLAFITNILYNTMLSDMETGAKMFKTEVLKDMNLTSQGFGFEPEFTAKVFKRGYRVQEVPIVYCGRNYKEGKKIKAFDGLKAVYYLLKYRFRD